MLFARFLAENHLLIHEEMGVPVSLAECEELAKEEGTDGWALAARFASRMLPQIFRPDDPVLAVTLAPESRRALEKQLDTLPTEVFTADDSLGWVYQFWQTKRKYEINASGNKIGADELPAVTQLFTEHYMVLFLLHNTLGAWWVEAASRRFPEVKQRLEAASTKAEARAAVALPDYTFDYLRFVKVEAASSRFAATLQDATSTISFFDPKADIANLSGNLPHWRQEGVTYFVTFRTDDSIPQEKLREWEKEREKWIAAHPEPHDEATRRDYYQRFPARFHEWLDNGYGACVLKQTECGQIVENALKHFDGQRYDLDEFVVMPNHVHVLVIPRPDHELSDILHSWKSFTAKEINKATGRTGTFWQKESFDHIVRGPHQLERIREYIRENPEKAGLKDEAASKVEAASRCLKEEAARRCLKEETRRDAASTWRPAAGTFPGWPTRAKDLKILDPCCGSGHFLVAAFDLVVRIRIQEEGLSTRDACDAVLRDNIFGLEIDQRCTQIAAFALALAAWKFSDGGGYRDLPTLHIACSGIGPQASEDQWLKLAEQSGVPMPAGGRQPIRDGLLNLHGLFSQAPTLGSLIDPGQLPGDLIAADYETLQPYLAAILKAEKADDETRERAVAAAGMVKAAELLASEYTLVITNVPYLGRGKQDDTLKAHLEKHYKEGKADLATAFVMRCLDLSAPDGTVALVTPQNWLFLTTYTKLREGLLKCRTWNVVVRLGPGAFETIGGHVVNVTLLALSARKPGEVATMAGIDVSVAKQPAEKAALLRGDMPADITLIPQAEQLKNADARILLSEVRLDDLLAAHADSFEGMTVGDLSRFALQFWEIRWPDTKWERFVGASDTTHDWGARDQVIRWEGGRGPMQCEGSTAIKGREAWGRLGVRVHQMQAMACTLYDGELFDKNGASVVPYRPEHTPAVYAFCQSQEFRTAVRVVDQALKITVKSFTKVSFDLAHWQKVAAEKYPNGLPEPENDDPTQWLFHGRVEESAAPLQVAVARLLGYRWPAELDDNMRLSKRARGLVKRCDELLKFADDDGVVCIPAVRGERTAADRVRAVLAAAFGDEWSPAKQEQLLASVGYGGKSLEDWLRNGFFEQHCKLFHYRPFVWHVWDGRKTDGFGALVNYHRLDAKLLEKLIYTYLGDWIKRQERAVTQGESGADARLLAAQQLQGKLKLIAEGEPPHDIFVRWKPIEQQPIGWNPDLNDGVRMNIRPFMEADILRKRPNIKWEKDRGKEPDRPREQYPWFFDERGKPTGDRVNDVHLTNAEKQAARKKAGVA